MSGSVAGLRGSPTLITSALFQSRYCPSERRLLISQIPASASSLISGSKGVALISTRNFSFDVPNSLKASSIQTIHPLVVIVRYPAVFREYRIELFELLKSINDQLSMCFQEFQIG